MTSISSMETITPEVRSHPPSSPEDDEDLGRRRIWEDGDDSELLSSSKGKHKEVEGEGSISDSGTYPPVNDEEAETRRVEENLRRWQAIEMQKRKSARESAAFKSQPTSDGWRTSSLWQKSNLRTKELGKHTALGSQDSIEHLPLDNIVTTPGPSPSPSPLPSPRRPPNVEDEPTNPFANPPTSPFDDSHQATAVMSPTEAPVADPNPTLAAPVSKRPMLLAQSSSFTAAQPPPPRPLDLPPPKTPPPPVDVPPLAVSPPSLQAQQLHEEPEKVRWWHEWLCGCGEDRDADNQGGRTNPFE